MMNLSLLLTTSIVNLCAYVNNGVYNVLLLDSQFSVGEAQHARDAAGHIV